MPIFVKDYTWKQNDKEVHISLPLKNVQRSKMSLFNGDKLIKFNFPPYIFQLVLKHAVVPTKTKCLIKVNEVVLELEKSIPGVWETLHEDVGKLDIVEMKKQIIDKEHENAIILEKQKETEKEFERKNFVHDYQMSIENEEKEIIRRAKDQLKAKAMRELMVWKQDVKNTEEHLSQITNCEQERKFISPISFPFPRKSGRITFSFTPRVFPTPKRESRAAEEEEWLKKEAEAIRTTGFLPSELTDEEKNPMWLLNKGMNFFQFGNYLGALNAFHYGCQIAPKMPIFYIRLAETNLKLNRCIKAIENATMALDLIKPVVPENKNMRAEAYKIRAEAYKIIEEPLLSSSDDKAAEMLLK